MPSPELTIEQLTRAMDDLDRAIPAASPLVADVFLDMTAHDGAFASREDVG